MRIIASDPELILYISVLPAQSVIWLLCLANGLYVTLENKVCQWLESGRCFFLTGPPVSPSEAVNRRMTDNTMAKRKRANNDVHNTTQERKTTRTPLKSGEELRCSRRVSSSCSTCGNRRVTLVANHEWGKDLNISVVICDTDIPLRLFVLWWWPFNVREIYTPYWGTAGMLLPIHVKFRTGKLK